MKINATLLGGECPRSFYLDGRIGQTLFLLHHAGKKGITLLENPAYQLAACVHSLCKMGFAITTERGPHGGDYPSYHARYRLQSTVILDGPAGGAAQ